MNPIEQNAAPELVPGPARITDRQVEIMTATLCEAVLNIRTHAGEDAPEVIGKLISAMVKQVGRLNDAIAAPAEPEVQMKIDLLGRAVVTPREIPEGSRSPERSSSC
ncbi:hypothetical protein [Burkholderia gladioli]|uniref:hypothetical protein n=1 Tax=Burkholderia gladioli TaxID=28095 RepID=UPI00164054F1|nr:hypothetical protein [Burkholderia gladioli]